MPEAKDFRSKVFPFNWSSPDCDVTGLGFVRPDLAKPCRIFVFARSGVNVIKLFFSVIYEFS
jgi:hypothetical protein